MGSNPTPSATQSPHISLCAVFHGKVDLTAHNAAISEAFHTPDLPYRRNRGPLAPTFSGVDARGFFSEDKRTYGFAVTALHSSVLVFQVILP